jgi:hypothetical protein
MNQAPTINMRVHFIEKVGLMNQAPTRNIRFHFIEKVGLINQAPTRKNIRFQKKYNIPMSKSRPYFETPD